MKNMKRNILLIPFVAIMTLMVLGFASAVPFNIERVTVAGIDVNDSMAGFAAGETVPVKVTFSADEYQSNVEIEVEFRGYDRTESISQDFGFVENGTLYHSKIFNLKIPSDIDEASEETNLYVTISSRDGETRESYALKLQRESYDLDILSVDYSSKISACDVFTVSVVV